MSLSDRKAFWVFEINFGINSFKQFTKTLAINLYKTILKPIGLKSKTFLGLCILGIKVMKVWLRLIGIVPEFRIAKTASNTSLPIFPDNYL